MSHRKCICAQCEDDRRDAARYRWIRQQVVLRRANTGAEPGVNVHLDYDYLWGLPYQVVPKEARDAEMRDLDALVDAKRTPPR